MRYLAVDYAPEEQMVGLNINAHLFRMNDGEVAMETQITSVAGCRLIVSA